MACPLCEQAARAGRGKHPWLIAELAESFALLGDNQGPRGWCVLVLKEHAEHVADLTADRQARLWDDVRHTAAAQRAVFGPVRINYECLGNLVPHVHWHLIPRHADDPQPRDPVWLWPRERQAGSMKDEDRRALVSSLRGALGR
ncbi:MAG: HIT family protein [Phycisphaerae bacterium]|nr:HIT family protein [Phycisphaerae bacterium]